MSKDAEVELSGIAKADSALSSVTEVGTWGMVHRALSLVLSWPPIASKTSSAAVVPTRPRSTTNRASTSAVSATPMFHKDASMEQGAKASGRT